MVLADRRRILSLSLGPSGEVLRAMASMDWDDYLRHEAAMYRQLAEKSENVFGKQELLDLAAVCEEVANNIEDRLTVGSPLKCTGLRHNAGQARGKIFPLQYQSEVSSCARKPSRPCHWHSMPVR